MPMVDMLYQDFTSYFSRATRASTCQATLPKRKLNAYITGRRERHEQPARDSTRTRCLRGPAARSAGLGLQPPGAHPARDRTGTDAELADRLSRELHSARGGLSDIRSGPRKHPRAQGSGWLDPSVSQCVPAPRRPLARWIGYLPGHHHLPLSWLELPP